MENEELEQRTTERIQLSNGLDRIRIKDLLLRCIVGINPDERTNRQDVVINLTLFVDLRKPGETDNIEDTVNYKTIKNGVVDLVESSSFRLVERLAEAVAQRCLENNMVRGVLVTIDKPGALRFARSVGVEIFRTHRR